MKTSVRELEGGKGKKRREAVAAVTVSVYQPGWSCAVQGKEEASPGKETTDFQK